MEFYTFVQSEPTLAIIPLIWIIGAVLAGTTIVGIIIANSDGTDTTTIEGKSLGILGMQESGKTQLLRTLQNKSYTTYEATSTDDYAPFTAIINGKSIKFQQGRDIGGDEKYIPPYYENFIKLKDAIFFLFDVEKYLSDAHYAQKVRDRLDFVHRKLKENAGSNIKSKYLVIGSHMDKLSSSSQKTALKDLQSSVSGKSYEELFHNNLLLCDLTDRTNFFKNLTERKIFE